MSSILDALKKVEQKSAKELGEGTPWPANETGKSVRRSKRLMWGVSVGTILIFSVLGIAVWKTGILQSPQSAPLKQTADLSARQSKDNSPPDANRQQPQTVNTGNRQTSRSSVDPEITSTPVKNAITATNDQGNNQGSGDSVKIKSPVGTTVKTLAPPPPAQVEPLLPAPLPKAELADKPPDTQQNILIEKTETTPPPPDETEGDVTHEPEKNFRDDPRIDLQALVWAPNASERFVVINNSLVKEGGIVGNFTVIEINPEDVLLAEGSDRWNQKFTIR